MKIRTKIWILLVTAMLTMAIFAGSASAQAPDKPQHNAIDVVAELLNMTPAELRAEIKAGNRLIEIAEARGIDKADVAEAVYGVGVDRVELALANGVLTQDQADRLLARLAKGRDACANEGRCNFRRLRQKIRQFHRQFRRISPVAEVLGMTTADLIEKLRSGQTIETIAAEQGITMDELATSVYDHVLDQVENALAEGKITQQQADRFLARLSKWRDMCISTGMCKAPWGR